MKKKGTGTENQNNAHQHPVDCFRVTDDLVTRQVFGTGQTPTTVVPDSSSPCSESPSPACLTTVWPLSVSPGQNRPYPWASLTIGPGTSYLFFPTCLGGGTFLSVTKKRSAISSADVMLVTLCFDLASSSLVSVNGNKDTVGSFIKGCVYFKYKFYNNEWTPNWFPVHLNFSICTNKEKIYISHLSLATITSLSVCKLSLVFSSSHIQW